jgi:hypothetical protein
MQAKFANQNFGKKVIDSFDELPACINDYNHNMSGVNITNQLCSCNQTHGVSTDLAPLFFWALDTAPFNSYIIYKDCPQVTNIKNNDFRILEGLSKTFVEK